ncbi:MAG: hypothetical protein ISQ13_01510 [Candidatus Margulisbacteria bacterium]|nr:hypothetical protein [Candidatus Margulisiibacteriota bacterium]
MTTSNNLKCLAIAGAASLAAVTPPPTNNNFCGYTLTQITPEHKKNFLTGVSPEYDKCLNLTTSKCHEKNNKNNYVSRPYGLVGEEIHCPPEVFPLTDTVLETASVGSLVIYDANNHQPYAHDVFFDKFKPIGGLKPGEVYTENVGPNYYAKEGDPINVSATPGFTPVATVISCDEKGNITFVVLPSIDTRSFSDNTCFDNTCKKK